MDLDGKQICQNKSLLKLLLKLVIHEMPVYWTTACIAETRTNRFQSETTTKTEAHTIVEPSKISSLPIVSGITNLYLPQCKSNEIC